MNNEMKKRLNTLVGADFLVSIYTEPDEPDSFTLGYLLQMDESNTLINMIDSFGEENGFCTIKLDEIFIFNGDKMYSEKLLKLFSLKQQKKGYMGVQDTNPILNLLKHVSDNNLLVEVNEDSNYRGFVSCYSSDTLVLNIIDDYCNDMGIATIDMTYINTLKCQNRYLKDLQLLINNKNNQLNITN